MDESRKQFEEWATSKNSSKLTSSSLTILKSGCYASESLERRWEAWQASRQALENNQKGE